MRPQIVRSSLFLMVVCLLSIPAYGQYGYSYFGRNKVQYEHFDWQVLETDHFEIYYYAAMEDLAHYGAGFAEEAYAELTNRFNLSLNHRIPLIFYSSNLHFKQTNVTPGFIPDNVGGFFEFLKGRVVVPSNGDIHRFRRVIHHELVHVFTYHKVVQVLRDHRQPLDRFLPLWFTEGLAEYWSGEPDAQHEMLIRDGIANNYLVPIDNLHRIHGSYQMYKQGEAICRFISETYGEEKLLAFIENIWKDRDTRKLLEITLRDPFEEIVARFDRWMLEQYYPLLAESDLPSLLADVVVSGGYSGKPAVYRKTDGARMVYFVGNRSGYGNLYGVEVDSSYRPVGRPAVYVKGERSEQFEAFHLFDSRIDISSDGRLVFVTKSGGRDVVHVYDIENDKLLDTFAFQNLVAIYSPSWSRDGARIAFSSIDQSGFSDLYVYDTNGETLDRLTNDSYDDRDPTWAPDDASIVFSSDRTSFGSNGAYNLFQLDLKDGALSYVTFGDRLDLSPRYSPDGSRIVFSGAEKDAAGRFSGQDLWTIRMDDHTGVSHSLAALGPIGSPADPTASTTRLLTRLTRLSSAAFDPVWTDDGHVLFSTFEHYRFTIRELGRMDSVAVQAEDRRAMRFEQVGERWSYTPIDEELVTKKRVYRRKYGLDIAQGGIQQNPIWGTSGGAFVAVSDMLGDDYWFFSLYNGARTQGEFLRSLSFSISRLQQQRRTNTAYGIFRHGGIRYDITDPDAAAEFPIFWETMYGGFGSVSYPLSQFRRFEVTTSLYWSDKEVVFRDIERKALLLSNALSLVHDNALYGYNGPMDGWRGNLTLAYTTDVVYSNVSYFSTILDVRHYLRLNRYLTFASWGLARANQGREARLFVMGGSWDLRGYPLFRMRGRKMWFTSQELRFPIVESPARLTPLLGMLGIMNLRGALFLDIAHAWNDDYALRDTRLLTGETLGSAGLGLRLNLFGGLVLRYDLGYRHRRGFSEWDRNQFRQFFFGWDF